MASMSHCVIENTAGELLECILKFTERQNDIQSNPYEKACIESLYKHCKEFVEAYEEYMEDPETYIAEHSEEEDWE